VAERYDEVDIHNVKVKIDDIRGGGRGRKGRQTASKFDDYRGSREACLATVDSLLAA
jgi:hypothetical protein